MWLQVAAAVASIVSALVAVIGFVVHLRTKNRNPR